VLKYEIEIGLMTIIFGLGNTSYLFRLWIVYGLIIVFILDGEIENNNSLYQIMMHTTSYLGINSQFSEIRGNQDSISDLASSRKIS